MRRPLSLKDHEISFTQFVFTIYKTQIGVGILTLPRDLVEATGTDGWISLIFGYAIAVTASVLIIAAMSKYPNDTLYELLPRLFGAWIGSGLSLLWIGYTAGGALVMLLWSVHLTQVWVLPGISNQTLMFLFVLPICLYTFQGLKLVGRFGEFVYLSSFWMPLALFWGLKDAHWLNFLPIGHNGWGNIIMAVKSTLLSFLGFELAFILYPYLKDKKKAIRGVVLANTLALITYSIATVVSFLQFSEETLKEYVWPSLVLLKLIRLPFVERFEIIFVALYLIILFATIIPYLYMAAMGANKLLRTSNHRYYTIAFLAGCVVLSMLFRPSFWQLEWMGKQYGKAGFLLVFLFPVFLWLWGIGYRFIRKERHP
ncbi:germination protein [Paenibacillus glycanilyticus]|uniref:Germination protein n=1 Tax=Paenibacillus glycanilyticus TaxID=126569 RepID=A0ABQ6NGI4_9BACL|nr:endospore germination permease [Paenibacillus glycanilyticus]GMK44191.1 germination protein [Paenibacillus glycanilyticus]